MKQPTFITKNIKNKQKVRKVGARGRIEQVVKPRVDLHKDGAGSFGMGDWTKRLGRS